MLRATETTDARASAARRASSTPREASRWARAFAIAAARPRGEQDDQLLVLVRELLAVLALAEVDVPERLAVDDHGRAEEGAHRRVPRREADGPRVAAEVGEAQRLRVVDQRAEHAAPGRERADQRARLLVHAVRDEAADATVGPEHAERAVAGAGQPAGDLDDVAQLRVQIEPARHHPAGAGEGGERVIVERVTHRTAVGGFYAAASARARRA